MFMQKSEGFFRLQKIQFYWDLRKDVPLKNESLSTYHVSNSSIGTSTFAAFHIQGTLKIHKYHNTEWFELESTLMTVWFQPPT